jgi:hypothetical protein
VLEFQSLLKQNNFGSKLSFDQSLKLSWRHTTIQTCFVPFLLTFAILFGPHDNLLQNKLCTLDGNSGQTNMNMRTTSGNQVFKFVLMLSYIYINVKFNLN